MGNFCWGGTLLWCHCCWLFISGGGKRFIDSDAWRSRLLHPWCCTVLVLQPPEIPGVVYCGTCMNNGYHATTPLPVLALDQHNTSGSTLHKLDCVQVLHAVERHHHAPVCMYTSVYNTTFFTPAPPHKTTYRRHIPCPTSNSTSLPQSRSRLGAASNVPRHEGAPHMHRNASASSPKPACSNR